MDSHATALEAFQAFMILLVLIGLPTIMHLYVSLMYILKLWDRPLPCDWYGCYRYDQAMHFKTQWWWLVGGVISVMVPRGMISERLLQPIQCGICNSTSSNDQCAHCSVEDDDGDDSNN